MKKLKKNKWPLIFTGVNIVLFITFFLVPAILGFYYSLTDYKGFGTANFLGFFRNCHFAEQQAHKGKALRENCFLLALDNFGYCCWGYLEMVVWRKFWLCELYHWEFRRRSRSLVLQCKRSICGNSVGSALGWDSI